MQFPSLCTCKTTQICPPIVYIYYASCFPKVVTASNIETDETVTEYPMKNGTELSLYATLTIGS